MSGDHLRPTVTVESHALSRIRLDREILRYLLIGLAIAGLAASLRFAIAPPRAPVRSIPTLLAQPDRAAEGFAVLVTRRYMTWNASEPRTTEEALAPFVGTYMEPDAGLGLPASGHQRVEWAEVVQERRAWAGQRVYTVAAQTDSGLRYLAITVARGPDGGLVLAGYPAFVGAPRSERSSSRAPLREVADGELATVIRRALSNYLSGSLGELQADLANGARVSVSSLTLSLDSVQRLEWVSDAHSVVALVQAHDGRGVAYVLEYELDVTRANGRWEVTRVETAPYQ